MKTKTVPFLLVAMLFAVTLAGCSADNPHYDGRAYRSGYMNVGAMSLLDDLHSNVSYLPLANMATDEGIYESANDINPILQMSESNAFYSVNFLPERVYNPNGLSIFLAVSVQNLRAMYQELNERFDYALALPIPLVYVGYFEGNEAFVDIPFGNVSDFINRRVIHEDGSREYLTPLKTIMLGRTLYQGFNESITQGRNLIESDFYKNSPSQAISVVLGSAYKDVFNIGDTLQLQLHWSLIDVEVVGFFGSGVGISGAFGDRVFDHSIIMPAFSFGYEPTDDENQIFQAFHYNQLTSGFIRISEPVYTINADTHARLVNNHHVRYETILHEMADRHGFTDVFRLDTALSRIKILEPNERHFAIVNLGADSVYVAYHGIMVPDNIDTELIANINAIYMGTLYDVLNLGLWNCETEFEKKFMWFGFPSIDDIRTFLVVEFLSSDNELLGHSITNSPIGNANTHECYKIEFTGIEIVNV